MHCTFDISPLLKKIIIYQWQVPSIKVTDQVQVREAASPKNWG